MTENLLIEIVKIVPSIVMIILICIIFFNLKKSIIEIMLPSITEINGLGIEIKFIEAKIKKTIKEKSEKLNLNYDLGVIKRADKNIKLLKDKNVLWVDDNISWIKDEVDIYRGLGIHVDISTTTDSAIEKLLNFDYDLIISDMKRDDNKSAGLDLLEEKNNHGNKIPLIFYVGYLDETKGVPGKSFGITSRLDELIHLTIDSFERNIN